MKPKRFDPAVDISPIPFTRAHCQAALDLKNAGLVWRPHVGCFVWDPNRKIPVPSPFQGNVYFILNLNHFLRVFGTVESMIDALVWLPTWYQVRVMCIRIGVHAQQMRGLASSSDPAEELLELYRGLCELLKTVGASG